MNPLEERIDQLERKVEQLEAQLADKEAAFKVDSKPSHRRHAHRHPDPEQAIRRAQQENSIWLFQGVRVLGFTLLLCLLCWGGVVLFEYSEKYFHQQGNQVVLEGPDPLQMQTVR